MKSLEERFWAKVDKDGPVFKGLGSCWVWTASCFQNGYGQFRENGTVARNHKAHRWAWQNIKGPIPEGLTLDHLCRNIKCVNPEHLEPVTIQENILRGEGFAGKNARKTACYKGHPFDETNTYLDKKGKRLCRICRNNTMREIRKKKKLKQMGVLVALLAIVLGLTHSKTAYADTSDWRDQLTVTLGGTANPQSRAILSGWADMAEHTKASFNYLATTKKMPGSTTLAGNRSGVQNYRDQQSGVEAMRWTLAQYPSFAAAVAKGDIQALVGQPAWKFQKYCGPSCNVTAYKQRLQQGYQQALQAGPTVTASPANPTTEAAGADAVSSEHQVTPSGIRMRYYILAAGGLVGFAGWIKSRRQQIITIFTAVSVMLIGDTLSARFAIPMVSRQAFQFTGYLWQSLTDPNVWGPPLIGGLLVFGLLWWSANKRGQTKELIQQFDLVKRLLLQAKSGVWAARNWIAITLIVFAGTYGAAQTQHGMYIVGLMVTAPAGWIILEHIEKEKVISPTQLSLGMEELAA